MDSVQSALNQNTPHFSFEGILDTEQDTEALGRQLASFLRVGVPVCLWGNLGAGKTTFARGLIQEWLKLQGIQGDVEIQSPTFSLLQFYETPDNALVHGDLYRLESVEELSELGLDELLEDYVMVIEWPDRWGEPLPLPRYDVKLTHLNNKRQVSIKCHLS